MKLNMWMIANRLSDLEPELHLKEEEPATLNSARTVYATNCVHIYEEQGSVICRHEDSYLKFYDLSQKQILDIVQSVFDFYEDWFEETTQAIMDGDYAKLCDNLTLVMQNPVSILDQNSKVLGISSAYDADSLDDEWHYMKTYGYTSMKSTIRMFSNCPNVNFLKPGLHRYQLKKRKGLSYDGLSYTMVSQDTGCGRVNVLNVDRTLNSGDCIILEKTARILELELSRKADLGETNEVSVFFNVLEGKPYSQKELELQYTRLGWNRTDSLFVSVFELFNPTDKQQKRLTQHLTAVQQQLARYLPHSLVIRKKDHLIVITNYKLMNNPQTRPYLSELAKLNPLNISGALPCQNIDELKFHYDQALFSLSYGKYITPGVTDWYNFLDYSVEYILNADSMAKKLSACCPEVISLYNHDEDRILFKTLKSFLSSNSIQQTSIDLNIHRNTAQYRIHKLAELLPFDFDNSYYREYLMLTVRIIELNKAMEDLKNI